MTNLEKYQEWRKSGMELNDKLLYSLSKDDLKIAARAVGVLKRNSFEFSGEMEQSLFFDFAINDCFNKDNENCVARYLENNIGDLTREEEKILNALLQAKPSLYEIVDIDTNNSTLKLVDLLNNGVELNITDIKLSESGFLTGFLVYTRVVCIDDIAMTSGAPFIFAGKHKALLLKEYPKMMKLFAFKNEQTKQALAFRKLYKKI